MSRSQNRANGPGPTSLPGLHKSHNSDAQQLPGASMTQAEMAKAFSDLARGEQQATTLEANLTKLESRLEELLASIEGGAATTTTPDSTSREKKEEPAPEKK
ncbi:hypothetical protein GGS21DRAFT_60406 [Xylaria nigripes]|nr:hypothetical protein GGS21DRAFT_60406 [Xylaria nigripes]